MAVAEPGSRKRLAEELGVSRASLYYRPKMRAKDEELRRRVEAIMLENPGYGFPRVAIALGIKEKRAARVMKNFGLKPTRRSKIPRKPEGIGRELETFSNKLCN